MRRLAPWLLLALLAGCAEEAPDATPEGALRAFIEAMEESRYDDSQRAEAYALLDEGSREELEGRVARAEALGRAGLEPWEMLATGRFRLSFEARSMSAEVVDGSGVVVVRGPRGERAEVSVVREEAGWRVRLLGEDSATDQPSDGQ